MQDEQAGNDEVERWLAVRKEAVLQIDPPTAEITRAGPPPLSYAGRKREDRSQPRMAEVGNI